MARWVIVCSADVQPVFTSGNSMDCSGSGGTLTIESVDTLVLESAPWVAHITSGEIPPVSDVAAIWGTGFSLVIICFLIGRAVGAVLEFIRKG